MKSRKVWCWISCIGLALLFMGGQIPYALASDDQDQEKDKFAIIFMIFMTADAGKDPTKLIPNLLTYFENRAKEKFLNNMIQVANDMGGNTGEEWRKYLSGLQRELNSPNPGHAYEAIEELQNALNNMPDKPSVKNMASNTGMSSGDNCPGGMMGALRTASVSPMATNDSLPASLLADLPVMKSTLVPISTQPSAADISSAVTRITNTMQQVGASGAPSQAQLNAITQSLNKLRIKASSADVSQIMQDARNPETRNKAIQEGLAKLRAAGLITSEQAATLTNSAGQAGRLSDALIGAIMNQLTASKTSAGMVAGGGAGGGGVALVPQPNGDIKIGGYTFLKDNNSSGDKVVLPPDKNGVVWTVTIDFTQITSQKGLLMTIFMNNRPLFDEIMAKRKPPAGKAEEKPELSIPHSPINEKISAFYNANQSLIGFPPQANTNSSSPQGWVRALYDDPNNKKLLAMVLGDLMTTGTLSQSTRDAGKDFLAKHNLTSMPSATLLQDALSQVAGDHELKNVAKNVMSVVKQALNKPVVNTFLNTVQAYLDSPDNMGAGSLINAVSVLQKTQGNNSMDGRGNGEMSANGGDGGNGMEMQTPTKPKPVVTTVALKSGATFTITKDGDQVSVAGVSSKAGEMIAGITLNSAGDAITGYTVASTGSMSGQPGLHVTKGDTFSDVQYDSSGRVTQQHIEHKEKWEQDGKSGYYGPFPLATYKYQYDDQGRVIQEVRDNSTGKTVSTRRYEGDSKTPVEDSTATTNSNGSSSQMTYTLKNGVPVKIVTTGTFTDPAGKIKTVRLTQYFSASVGPLPGIPAMGVPYGGQTISVGGMIQVREIFDGTDTSGNPSSRDVTKTGNYTGPVPEGVYTQPAQDMELNGIKFKIQPVGADKAEINATDSKGAAVKDVQYKMLGGRVQITGYTRETKEKTTDAPVPVMQNGRQMYATFYPGQDITKREKVTNLAYDDSGNILKQQTDISKVYPNGMTAPGPTQIVDKEADAKAKADADAKAATDAKARADADTKTAADAKAAEAAALKEAQTVVDNAPAMAAANKTAADEAAKIVADMQIKFEDAGKAASNAKANANAKAKVVADKLAAYAKATNAATEARNKVNFSQVAAANAAFYATAVKLSWQLANFINNNKTAYVTPVRRGQDGTVELNFNGKWCTTGQKYDASKFNAAPGQILKAKLVAVAGGGNPIEIHISSGTPTENVDVQAATISADNLQPSDKAEAAKYAKELKDAQTTADNAAAKATADRVAADAAAKVVADMQTPEARTKFAADLSVARADASKADADAKAAAVAKDAVVLVLKQAQMAADKAVAKAAADKAAAEVAAKVVANAAARVAADQPAAAQNVPNEVGGNTIKAPMPNVSEPKLEIKPAVEPPDTRKPVLVKPQEELPAPRLPIDYSPPQLDPRLDQLARKKALDNGGKVDIQGSLDNPTAYTFKNEAGEIVTRGDIQYGADGKENSYQDEIKSASGNVVRTEHVAGLVRDKDGKEISSQRLIRVADPLKGDETQTLKIMKDGKAEPDRVLVFDKNGVEKKTPEEPTKVVDPKMRELTLKALAANGGHIEEEKYTEGPYADQVKSYTTATKDAQGNVLEVKHEVLEYGKDKDGKMVETNYHEVMTDASGEEVMTVDRGGIKRDASGNQTDYHEVVTIKDKETKEMVRTYAVVENGKETAKATTALDKDGNEKSFETKSQKDNLALEALRDINKASQAGPQSASPGSMKKIAQKKFKEGMAVLEQQFAKLDASVRESTAKIDKMVEQGQAMRNAQRHEDTESRSGKKPEREAAPAGAHQE